MTVEHKGGAPKGSKNAQKESQTRSLRLNIRVQPADRELIDSVAEASKPDKSMNDLLLDAIRPAFKRLHKKLDL